MVLKSSAVKVPSLRTLTTIRPLPSTCRCEFAAIGGFTFGSVFTMIAVALTMKKISSRNTMSIIGDMSKVHSASGSADAFRSLEEAMVWGICGFAGLQEDPRRRSCGAHPKPQTAMPSGILA